MSQGAKVSKAFIAVATKVPRNRSNQFHVARATRVPRKAAATRIPRNRGNPLRQPISYIAETITSHKKLKATKVL